MAYRNEDMMGEGLAGDGNGVVGLDFCYSFSFKTLRLHNEYDCQFIKLFVETVFHL